MVEIIKNHKAADLCYFDHSLVHKDTCRSVKGLAHFLRTSVTLFETREMENLTPWQKSCRLGLLIIAPCIFTGRVILERHCMLVME
jgi:hypothetical protein